MKKGKRMPSQPFSRGAVPAGQASCTHHSKARATWPSRWPCAPGQRAGVLSEANQGPEWQMTPFPYYLNSSS